MLRAARWKLAVPGLVLAAGCAELSLTPEPPLPLTRPLPPPPAAAAYLPAPEDGIITAEKPAHSAAIVRVSAQEPAPAPAPEPLPPPAAAAPAIDAPAKVLPVSLDAVLRLAESQNPQVAVARERICQAYAEQDVAAKKVLPDVYVGVGYWRHEGGIQLQEGPLVRSSTGAVFGGLDAIARLDLRAAAFARLDAERKTLQQKGELRRITTEVLLEASNAYIDLLAAHSGLAIARGLDGDLRSLLNRAEKLANVEKGARIEAVRVRAEINGQAQMVRKLEGQARSAAVRLAYLLGVDPAAELLPVDGQLVAFRLVDAGQPVEALVQQALAHGPGLRELEAILALIQDGLCRAQGPQRWLPVFEVEVLEGAFGAGRGASLAFANRFDLGVRAKWNLTDACTADARKRVAQSALAQTQLTHADVRAKLALGVREARETVQSGEQELALATEQILNAKTAAELSEMRLTEGIAGASFSEVLLSKRAVAAAQALYLGVLRDFDKAQLRLLVLCGAAPLPAAAAKTQ